MKLLSSILLGFFCLLCTHQTYAQSMSLESAVSNLFEKPEKVVWVKHYNGRVNDLHDVAVTLAYDGKHCKGQLKYLRSKEVYGLAGFIKNNKIRLREINQSEKTSGYIEAELNGKVISGSWSTTDNSLTGNLVLNESNQPANLPTYCGDNKWIRTYNGTVDRKDITLLLQSENEGQLRGFAYFYKLDKTFEVKGSLSEKNKVVLRIYNDHAFLEGTIIGYLSDKGIIEAGYTGTDKKQQMCSFWEQEQWPMACAEYSEYIGSYDVTYPRSKHRALNQWMEQTSDQWLKKCRAQIKAVKQEGKELTADDRLAVRAYAWCELHYVSSAVVSGVMMMNSTWEEVPALEVFNFDLTTGKNIEIDDLFEKDFDYQKFVWEYLGTSVKAHKYYEDYNFRKWLAAESFVAFAIQEDGISFSTTDNAIYGRQRVTVPYESLLPHFKKDSPIWDKANIGKVQADIKNGN